MFGLRMRPFVFIGFNNSLLASNYRHDATYFEYDCTLIPFHGRFDHTNLNCILDDKLTPVLFSVQYWHNYACFITVLSQDFEH